MWRRHFACRLEWGRQFPLPGADERPNTEEDCRISIRTIPYSRPRFRRSRCVFDRRASGPLWRKDPPIANPVSPTIPIGDCERRNPCADGMLKRIDGRKRKPYPGRERAAVLQDESYDRYLRRSCQIGRISAYIEENPVSAGLVCSAELWPWSSAGWQVESRLGAGVTHSAVPFPNPAHQTGRADSRILCVWPPELCGDLKVPDIIRRCPTHRQSPLPPSSETHQK